MQLGFRISNFSFKRQVQRYTIQKVKFNTNKFILNKLRLNNHKKRVNRKKNLLNKNISFSKKQNDNKNKIKTSVIKCQIKLGFYLVFFLLEHKKKRSCC